MEQKPLGAELDGEKTAEKRPLSYKGQPFFTVFITKDNIEMKIANVNNEKVSRQSGIIEVECIRKSNSIEPRYTLSNVFDHASGLWYGRVLGWDDRMGAVKWQRIQIGDHKRFDLSKPDDRLAWAVMSRSTRLIGSPNQKGKALYRVHDREEEAREIIEKSSMRSRAMEIATKEISIEEMMDMYRVFGQVGEGLSPTRLQAELIKIAERNPKEFYDAWSSTNRGVLMTFKRCQATGLISFNLDKGGFMWRDTLALGVTEQTAMDYLVKNPTVLQQAERESKDLDFQTKNVKGQSKEEREFFGEVKEDDPELLELHQIAQIMNIEGYQKMTKEALNKAVENATAT